MLDGVALVWGQVGVEGVESLREVVFYLFAAFSAVGRRRVQGVYRLGDVEDAHLLAKRRQFEQLVDQRDERFGGGEQLLAGCGIGGVEQVGEFFSAAGAQLVDKISSISSCSSGTL